MLSRREISAVELTQAFLSRIDATDTETGAFITVDREGALCSARESDKRRAAGESLGIFDGIPYSLKDNISTKGIETTCASRILRGYIPPYDATVAAKLKNSGAVLLGKNNLDEFGMGSETVNGAYMLCRNPHDRSRIAGGSSGGSAASVADGTSVFSLGSDTGGSVRLPASHCGVVGLKPTYSAVSRYGLVSYASSLDVVGMLCKNVADTRAVFDLIRGRDIYDQTTRDFSRSCGDISLKGLRIALPKELLGADLSDEVSIALDFSIKMLEAEGAIIEEVSLPSIKQSAAAYLVLSMAEASSNLGRYDGIRYGHRSEMTAETVGEHISRTRGEGFGDEVKRRILAGTYFLSENGREKYYKNALSAMNLICAEYAALFERFDAMISPVATRSAKKIGEKTTKAEGYREDEFTVCANLTGIPAISVPCPCVSGMPVGIQLSASHGREDVLFSLSDAIERGTGK